MQVLAPVSVTVVAIVVAVLIVICIVIAIANVNHNRGSNSNSHRSARRSIGNRKSKINSTRMSKFHSKDKRNLNTTIKRCINVEGTIEQGQGQLQIVGSGAHDACEQDCFEGFLAWPCNSRFLAALAALVSDQGIVLTCFCPRSLVLALGADLGGGGRGVGFISWRSGAAQRARGRAVDPRHDVFFATRLPGDAPSPGTYAMRENARPPPEFQIHQARFSQVRCSPLVSCLAAVALLVGMSGS